MALKSKCKHKLGMNDKDCHESELLLLCLSFLNKGLKVLFKGKYCSVMYVLSYLLLCFLCPFQETRSNEESTDESEVTLLKIFHTQICVSAVRASFLSIWSEKYYFTGSF